jgi:hypothetical protein
MRISVCLSNASRRPPTFEFFLMCPHGSVRRRRGLSAQSIMRGSAARRVFRFGSLRRLRRAITVPSPQGTDSRANHGRSNAEDGVGNCPVRSKRTTPHRVCSHQWVYRRYAGAGSIVPAEAVHSWLRPASASNHAGTLSRLLRAARRSIHRTESLHREFQFPMPAHSRESETACFNTASAHLAISCRAA